MNEPDTESSSQHIVGSFLTTRWSLVRSASDPSSSIAHGALEELCRMYWYPLYCYVRRRGYSPPDAQDLVQGFFIRLFSRDLFGIASPAMGRLRGFLLSSLKYFLADDRKRAAAVKRGGNVQLVPLILDDAEERFSAEPPAPTCPDSDMDRVWALEVLRRAVIRLREKWQIEGKGELFDALSQYLLTPLDAGRAQQLAERFQMTENHIKVSLSRLRPIYREAIRSEVAETVSSEDQIDEEIAALKKALGL